MMKPDRTLSLLHKCGQLKRQEIIQLLLDCFTLTLYKQKHCC